MKLANQIMNYRRISWLTAFAFVAIGIMSWVTMPKEEDPRLKERFGVIAIPYPGASPQQVASRVLQPLEKELAKIAEIKLVRSTARFEFGLVQIDLKDSLSDQNLINKAWDDVRLSMDEAKKEWPSAVQDEELNRSILDQDAIVYAIVGDGQSRLDLLETAKSLKQSLLQTKGVKTVNILGDPGEQISVRLKVEELKKRGISFNQIASLINASNQPLGSGSIEIGSKKTGILANTVFDQIDELNELPVFYNAGSYIPLGEIASIEKTPKLPAEEWMTWNGENSVGIGIVPETQIDLIQLGKRVRNQISQFPIPENQRLETISFQPDYVNSRLKELSLSLVSGMGIIALVLILTMGLRVGLFVAFMVPAVTLTSLGFYSYSGGVMQQISIAAFVLALGLLVDNLIVIVEGVQEKLNNGISRKDSAVQTINEFIAPLAAATGTTIASFVPLLGSSGATADFTRAIPQVTTLTLAISYIFAVFVTPTISAYILKPKKKSGPTLLEKTANWISKPSKKFPVFTLLVCFGLLIGTIPLASQLKQQFFPLADRDQLVASIEMPEGTNLKSTKEAATKLAKAIEKIESVESVGLFVGRSVPRFFYNLNQSSKSPHLAQMIITTKDFSLSTQVRERVEELGNQVIPEAQVIAKNLGQGPPVDADLEIQIVGNNRQALAESASRIQKMMRQDTGTVDVRSDLGIGQSNVTFMINDINAMRYGLTRSAVTQAIIAQSRGLAVSKYRADRDPIDIVLMSNANDTNSLQDLNNAYIAPSKSGNLLLKDVANKKLSFEPSVLKFRNGTPVVHVYGELKPGFAFNQVLTPILKDLEAKPLPEGTAWQLGGASGESDSANEAILKVLPLGILMLLVSLLAQFNSFRKLLIINLVVPFIAIGIVPGLLIMDLPFGFFSLLGALALIGIVVNNAILLVDYADLQIKKGLSVKEAMANSVKRRLRPILLTTLTTVAGLLPLAFSKATLWPPFAFAVIFGLMASSILALFVVPSAYILIYGKKVKQTRRVSLATFKETSSSVVTICLIAISAAFAQPVEANNRISLNQAISQAKQHELVKASFRDIEEVQYLKEMQKALAFYPKLGLQIARTWQGQDLKSEGPMGSTIDGPPKASWQNALVIQQPIFDINTMQTAMESIEKTRQAKKHSANFQLASAKYQTALIYLNLLDLTVRRDALLALQNQLNQRNQELNRLKVLGLVRELDRATVQLALRDAMQGIEEFNTLIPTIEKLLGRSIGKNVQIKVQDFYQFQKNAESWIKALQKESSAPGKRQDIRALNTNLEQLAIEIKKTNREIWPKFYLQGQRVHSDPSPYTDSSWNEVTLTMKVDIWNGGTRSAKKRVILNQQQVSQLKIEAKSQQLKTEADRAWADFENARRSIDKEKQNLQIINRAVRAERRLYTQGKSTLGDVLDGELLIRDKRLLWHQSYIKAIKSLLESLFLSGKPLVLGQSTGI